MKSIFRTLLLSGSIFAAVLVSFSQSGSTFRDWELMHQNGIAAIVEGRIITMEEVRQKMDPLLPQVYRESRNQREFEQNVEMLAQEILQNEIDHMLIVQAFRDEEKFQIPSSVVRNEFENAIAADFDGDRSKLLAYLRGRNKTIADFYREIEEEIIVSVMRSRNRQSEAEVSPERIERFYHENKIRFYQEESIRLRQIVLVPYANEGPQLLLQNAQRIVEELNEGASFADLARQHSQDDMARRGGDWGWIEYSDIRPELADVAFTLGKGEFSEPFVFNNQVFILYVEDRIDERIQPLSEVRATIERFIMSQLSRENQGRWLERLRANGYVRVFL